eukprot:CAMPEP_0202891214 /NCGR_PEP_ID=MMETSP1392-20130828/1330_1 /ASSEMBLY_ACC=CAM_ASM_000868 /TAXON_ID=225041 /ORGANISM="Chlamydomonas chlamydogama, Strain SAG 11-48b" /LENGTH=497 /DNA_ID=CAMNT_0049574899 /DNA_START=74 /DNA_END=1567 /DNA_ORIENTATION=+
MTIQDDVNERAVQKEFWEEHTDGKLQSMFLDSQGPVLDAYDRPEVIRLLGDVKGKRVVELGAGIGRFTGDLAAAGAASILAVDFIEGNTQENHKANGHLPGVKCLTADVTELQLPPGSVDIVFSNWLLMYLNDREVQDLANRMLSWVGEDGCVFLRESCFRQSGDRQRNFNPSHYRHPREYFRIFEAARLGPAKNVPADVSSPDKENVGPAGNAQQSGSSDSTAAGAESRFELEFCRSLEAYARIKGNPGQVCWRWKRVCATPNHACMLNGTSYTVPREEELQAAGRVCSREEAQVLGECLALQPGDRVLEVGCGVAPLSGPLNASCQVHYHGMDSSVTDILTALEIVAARPKLAATLPTPDVPDSCACGMVTKSGICTGAADGTCKTFGRPACTFEVADVTSLPEQHHPHNYFKAAVLHAASQPVSTWAKTLSSIKPWLHPGGRLLLTVGSEDPYLHELQEAGYTAQPVDGIPAKALLSAGGEQGSVRTILAIRQD